MSAELEFRKLDIEGVNTLIDWASKEGWNPGIHDASLFYHADPDGFYGYFDQGTMIAGGSLVSYEGKFGFMGLFIVAPEFRHLGIGRSLWFQRRDTLLKRLMPGASIGMDGVVAMQAFYAKGGFQLAFRDERYIIQGRLGETDSHVHAASENDMPEILRWDAHCFGFERTSFISQWVKQPQSHSFVYKNNQGMQGFALMRKAQVGYKIGPLFAENAAIAKALYEACMHAAPEENIYLDIPVNNTDAVNLVQHMGAAYVFECARMYYGAAPALPISNIFGITSFELG